MIALMMAAAVLTAGANPANEVFSCSQSGRNGKPPEVITYVRDGDTIVMQRFQFVRFRVVFDSPDAIVATYPSITGSGEDTRVNARTISINRRSGEMLVSNIDIGGAPEDNTPASGRCEWIRH